ncbi:MAG: PIN domain-containing protein [Bacteroidota bacterium]|nr:PIN domain-containing protein [Bacteroidota bacterium]
MLNNLFIDTDVILDIVLDREDFFENSSKIFRQFETGEVLLFTSPSIIISAQYIGQRLIAKQKCRSTINYLLNYFIILEANLHVIKKAYQSKFSDIDDAIQYYTATQDDQINYFITRNIKDFKSGESDLSIVSPSQFLKLLK